LRKNKFRLGFFPSDHGGNHTPPPLPLATPHPQINCDNTNPVLEKAPGFFANGLDAGSLF
jgi:hypothetical protein